MRVGVGLAVAKENPRGSAIWGVGSGVGQGPPQRQASGSSAVSPQPAIAVKMQKITRPIKTTILPRTCSPGFEF